MGVLAYLVVSVAISILDSSAADYIARKDADASKGRTSLSLLRKLPMYESNRYVETESPFHRNDDPTNYVWTALRFVDDILDFRSFERARRDAEFSANVTTITVYNVSDAFVAEHNAAANAESESPDNLPLSIATNKDSPLIIGSNESDASVVSAYPKPESVNSDVDVTEPVEAYSSSNGNEHDRLKEDYMNIMEPREESAGSLFPMNGIDSSGIHTINQPTSWLDVFLCKHRTYSWIVFNMMMVILEVVTCGLSIYRLLWLNVCTLLLPRTHYLVIHLLIFTALIFRFVQLLHLSFGGEEGLPLVLTLILTHTPMSCLCSCLVLAIHRILKVCCVTFFRFFLPSVRHLAFGVSSYVTLSVFGDIMIGASYSRAALIIIRLTLLVSALLIFSLYIKRYFVIVSLSHKLQRELVTEQKLLVAPNNLNSRQAEVKHLIRDRMVNWARCVFAACLICFLYSMFNFSLSMFFTVSYIPITLWWFCHASECVLQIMVALLLLFAAGLTQQDIEGGKFFLRFVTLDKDKTCLDDSTMDRGTFVFEHVTCSSCAECPPRNIFQETEMMNFSVRRAENTRIHVYPSPEVPRHKATIRRAATFNGVPKYPYQRPTERSTNSCTPGRSCARVASTSLLPIQEIRGPLPESSNNLFIHKNNPYWSRVNDINMKRLNDAEDITSVAHQNIVGLNKNVNVYNVDSSSSDSSSGDITQKNFREKVHVPTTTPFGVSATSPLICRIIDSKELSGGNYRYPNLPLTTFNTKINDRNIVPPSLHTANFDYDSHKVPSSVEIIQSKNCAPPPKPFPLAPVKSEISLDSDDDLEIPQVAIAEPEDTEHTDLLSSAESSGSLTPSCAKEVFMNSADNIFASESVSTLDREKNSTHCSSGSQKKDAETISVKSSQLVLPAKTTVDEFSKEKRSSLKRSTSAATDYNPRHSFGRIQEDSRRFSSIRMPKHLKSNYSWYGTWAGRKRSHCGVKGTKSDSESRDLHGEISESLDSKAFRKLTSSKGSLLSLYSKIKGRRHSKNYLSENADLECVEAETFLDKGSGAENISQNSHPESDCPGGNKEQENEGDDLLSKIKDPTDVDWTLEMIKSSRLLADFYALGSEPVEVIEETKEEDLKEEVTT